MVTNVFDLMATLGLDTSKYEEGLKGAKSKGTEVGSIIGSGLMGAAKIGAAAVGTATVAVAGLSKEAFSSYANYEQLIGGVEKLYGSASGQIQAYADQAYKTSGMSANQYMETATNFSAALIGSLNGDVNKAADLTDVAMRAMSDNVNVFGSDMGSVTNAFQGFAKQNYTMLDNLKLGYGGTKQEMQRLIDDANKYRESIGETSDLSIESFADIIQAIQSVQEAQNIAGTTNKEAMTTIEGSANATKAAWDNVITSIGRGENISESIQGLINSIFGEKEGEGLLNQIIPRIETIFNGIGEFIATAGPFFADKIPILIENVLPTILQSGAILVENLAKGLIEALPFIMDSATQIVMQFANTILELLPEIAEIAIQIVENLATSIAEAAPTLIPNAVDAIIETLITFLDNYDALVNGSIALVTGLTDGIMNSLPILIDRLPEIIVKIVEALIINAPKMLMVGPQLILSLVNGIIKSIPKLVTMAPKLIGELVNALIKDAPKLVQNGIDFVKRMIEGIMQMLPNLLMLPVDIVAQMVSIFTTEGKQLIENGKELGNNVKEGISEFVEEAVQWGKDLIENFAAGIKSKIDYVRSLISDLAASVSELIGFSEPEKGPLSDFHTYAPDMMKLFAKGVKDNEKIVEDQISRSFDFGNIIRDQDLDVVDASPMNKNAIGIASGGMVQNLTINAPQELNPSEIARQTRNANREFVLQMRMA